MAVNKIAPDKQRYPEKAVQLGFVPWYEKNCGYVEWIEDIDGGFGSPVDSVGFIGERPVLVEFKHVVGATTIFHSPTSGSSIELKIVRALKALDGKDDARIAATFSSWDQKTAPLFVLVASRIGEGALENLKALVDSRQNDWKFSFQAYTWDGLSADLVLASMLPDAGYALDSSPLPDIKAYAPVRPKGMREEDVRNLLADEGLQRIFEAFVEPLKAKGGRPATGATVSNLNYTMKDPNTDKPRTVVGLWPHHSWPDEGLLVSYSVPDLAACLGVPETRLAEVPGVDGPPVGYLNSQKFLLSVDDAEGFWLTVTAG